MVTQEQNEFLTRTDPGTPMGELFRRYWIPALLDWELPERDCPPVRVKLLGEKLVAFRDTEGRIGMIEEFCAHRGVSLWFGRNEECGLRCPYHGWKYDVNGQCVDLASEPEESGMRRGIKLKSYPGVELGGVIWTYMGPPEEKPPLPNFEWVHLPPSHRVTTKRWQESNYLQAIEGGIDSSHVSFLHRGDLASDPFHRNTAGAKFAKSTKTTFHILDSAGGLIIGARRDADPGSYYNGVRGLAMQDASVQESMGPIADRTKEHLRSTDRAIIIARQRLLKAGKEVQEGGKAPGLSPEAQLVRSASFVIPVEADFEEHALDAVKYRQGAPHVAV